jgi:hypothetical protein
VRSDSAAAPPAVLSIRPIDDNHILLDVVAHGMPPIYGADLRLTFDPSVLTAVDASGRIGVQGAPGSAWGGDGEYFVALNSIDNEAGTIAFVASRMSPAQAIRGDLVLLSVTFALSGTATDESVRLASVLLTDVTRKVETRWVGTDIFPTGSATWLHRAYLPSLGRGSAER